MNNDHIHGDEHLNPDLTPQQQVDIEVRAKEMIAARLENREQFSGIAQYIDPPEIDSHIHRVLQNLDRAIGGERIALDAIFNALCHLQRRIQVEAESVWMDECKKTAEQELIP